MMCAVDYLFRDAVSNLATDASSPSHIQTQAARVIRCCNAFREIHDVLIVSTLFLYFSSSLPVFYRSTDDIQSLLTNLLDLPGTVHGRTSRSYVLVLVLCTSYSG